MIRQAAFESKNKLLKGGLHIHTTRSDGDLTPEEVIKLYRENDYDFIAITDHKRYNAVNSAPETGMIVIPGMEFDRSFEPTGEGGFRCFHTVCLGPEEGNGFSHDEKFAYGTVSGQEEYQTFLDDIHAKNNLTFYCHPQWSSTPARYFEKQKGNFAIEVWNTAAAMENDADKDAPYWDELLGQGLRIFGVATDDGHNPWNYCKGWVMLNSEGNIPSILDALKEGKFYSSCGPEIYDFYIDGDIAFIDCSPTAKIRLHSDRHFTRLEISEDASLTHAEFKIDGDWDGPYDNYVRISIVDKDGKMAWTNPIFLK